METTALLQILMVIGGVIFLGLTFLEYAKKKMIAEIGLLWSFFSMLIVGIGLIPGSLSWIGHIRRSMALVMFGFAFFFLLLLLYLSIAISQLLRKNLELAMQTSLLNQENEQVLMKLNMLPEKSRQEESGRKELLIIIPAYNEEKNISVILEKIHASGVWKFADVLIINDASKDATGRIAKNRYHEPVVTHVFNLGYGSALQLGYKYAVRRDYSYVIQMDGDGQHDVCNIQKIYRELKTRDADGSCPDIVLGSRFMEGSSTFPVSACKKFAFWMFRHIIHWGTGRKIADPTTGLQGLNRRTFLYYSFYRNFDNQYPDANMIIQMLLLGYKIREIPAVMHARTDGVSMHSGLRPVVYMFRMFFSIMAVIFRIKVLKMDVGAVDDAMVEAERG